MVNCVYVDSPGTSLICIDRYEKGIPCGRIYNSYFKKQIEFEGVIELLKTLEGFVETIDRPQSFSERREFRRNGAMKNSDASFEEINLGKIATFSVRLLFRQNASWQGSVSWHEGKTEESFRSVLELLLLIDSALS